MLMLLNIDIQLGINIKIYLFFVSIQTVEVALFVTGVETLQILGVEMSTGGSTESNVRSFEAFLTTYLSLITGFMDVELGKNI
jgi:hypothetical protein